MRSFFIRSLKLRRKFQVLKFAWKDSKVVAKQNGVNHLSVYKDMLKFLRKLLPCELLLHLQG